MQTTQHNILLASHQVQSKSTYEFTMSYAKRDTKTLSNKRITIGIILIYCLAQVGWAQCFKIQQHSKRQYQLIDDDDDLHVYTDLKGPSSIYIENDLVLTLTHLSKHEITVSTYDSISLQLKEQQNFKQQCDQAIIVTMSTLLCTLGETPSLVQYFRMQKDQTLHLLQSIQIQGEIVAVYQDQEVAEVYTKKGHSLKCTGLNSQSCLSTHYQTIVEQMGNTPQFIKYNSTSSLSIVRSNQRSGPEPSTSLNSLQEHIMPQDQQMQRQLLGVAPSFNGYVSGSTIASFSLALGSTQDIFLPSIVDEHPWTVKITVQETQIPYCNVISLNSHYQLAPYQYAFNKACRGDIYMKLPIIIV